MNSVSLVRICCVPNVPALVCEWWLNLPPTTCMKVKTVFTFLTKSSVGIKMFFSQAERLRAAKAAALRCTSRSEKKKKKIPDAVRPRWAEMGCGFFWLAGW